MMTAEQRFNGEIKYCLFGLIVHVSQQYIKFKKKILK